MSAYRIYSFGKSNLRPYPSRHEVNGRCQINQNINKFWELLGAVLAVDLRSLNYDQRLATLLERGVGLWDVIAEAERAGSLDSAIANVSHNPLIGLSETLPNLLAIAFNGGTAARIGRKQLQGSAACPLLIDLPSSSPAHTIGFESKLEVWSQLSHYLS